MIYLTSFGRDLNEIKTYAMLDDHGNLYWTRDLYSNDRLGTLLELGLMTYHSTVGEMEQKGVYLREQDGRKAILHLGRYLYKVDRKVLEKLICVADSHLPRRISFAELQQAISS